MRRSWAVPRRPRAVLTVLAVLAAVAAAMSPAGAQVAQRLQHADRPVAVQVRPDAHPPSPTGSAVPTSTALAPSPAATNGPPGKVLYLTFDDGPDPQWTPQVLQLLAGYSAKATFFQVGEQVRKHPQLALDVRAAGHAVGNHTAHHRRLTTLSGGALHAEIVGGVPSSGCLRPPYGAVDAEVHQVATRLRQRVVLWTVDTEDWSKPGAPKITRALLTGAASGAIVLMHDGGGNRAQTLAGLAAALPGLVARGYRFAALPGC